MEAIDGQDEINNALLTSIRAKLKVLDVISK